MQGILVTPRLRRWLEMMCVWVSLSLMQGHTFAGVALSQPFLNRVVLTDAQGDYPLGLNLGILEDPAKSLTFEQVSTSAYADAFVPSTKAVPGFGYSASAYWLRIDIDRRTTREQGWMLEFGYAPMQWIDVYTLTENGEVQHQRGGARLPHAARPYAHHKHVFELTLPQQQVTRLFVRVDGESSKTMPLHLYRADVFAQTTGYEISMLSLYAGIIIALFLYNIFIFLTLRESTYLYYVCFLGSALLFLMSLSGVSQFLLLADYPEIGIRLIPFGMAMMELSSGLFMIRFLGTRASLPTLHRILQIALALGAIGCVLPWVISYRISNIFSASLAIFLAIMALVISTAAVLQGNQSARYFLLAWCALLVGILLQALRAFGLLPTNIVTEYALLWGSAIEAVLLSVALAARMREMRAEKTQAQQALLAAQQETVAAQQEALDSKQTALDTIQGYSHKLENEVKIRTAELIETQQKLIASEKMAALGVFTAGMAHEINNPANFIAVGAQNAMAQLVEFKAFVNQLLDEDTDALINDAFEKRFSKMNASITTISEGIKRIERVVKQLRTDHPEGNADMLPIDVIASLESAWRVLSPTLKVPITLACAFVARPMIFCLVAEMHQVFIALLSNAAHAIEDAQRNNSQDYEGVIAVRSFLEEHALVIIINDNGVGIPPEILGKVFDPFFTTKEVGRGAGLGLSMARDVVMKHHGTLEVSCAAGEGATFTLRLPCQTENFVSPGSPYQ